MLHAYCYIQHNTVHDTYHVYSAIDATYCAGNRWHLNRTLHKLWRVLIRPGMYDSMNTSLTRLNPVHQHVSSDIV